MLSRGQRAEGREQSKSGAIRFAIALFCPLFSALCSLFINFVCAVGNATSVASKQRAVLLELFVYFLCHIVCLDAELGIYSEDGTEIGKDDFPDYHRFKIGTILESNSIDEDKWLLVKTGFKLCKNYPKLLRKILKLSMSKVILGDSMNLAQFLQVERWTLLAEN